MTVSHNSLVLDHKISGIDTSDLTSLDLGRNYNLTSDDIADIRLQAIAVDYNNDPSPYNISDQVPQQVNPFN